MEKLRAKLDTSLLPHLITLFVKPEKYATIGTRISMSNIGDRRNSLVSAPAVAENEGCVFCNFTRFSRGTNWGIQSMASAQGNSELFQQAYLALRDLASLLLSRERVDHTLQPTALVNEAFLKLDNQFRQTSRESLWNSKTHFQVVAARAMRQILVDHARKRSTEKRGGQWQRITMSPGVLGESNEIDFEALDEALILLAETDQRKSRVVELRFFGGLTCQEIATELDISPKTVEADWYFARAWLRKELSEVDHE